MARIVGDREAEVETSADISALGSEGEITYKTEIWTVPAATTIAANDDLESNVLVVPGGSKILSIEVARNWSARMILQYRDITPGSATPATWTALVTETADSANELVAPRSHAEMLKTLTNDREFRLRVVVQRTGGAIVKAIIQFGNI